ncbi:hypothetical protein [Rhodococcus globerulus]
MSKSSVRCGWLYALSRICSTAATFAPSSVLSPGIVNRTYVFLS